MDIKQAMLNPAMVFKQPDDVVASSELTEEEKIQVLKNWEYDIREEEVAEEEGMPVPGRHRNTLKRITEALRALNYQAGDHGSSKQG